MEVGRGSGRASSVEIHPGFQIEREQLIPSMASMTSENQVGKSVGRLSIVHGRDCKSR